MIEYKGFGFVDLSGRKQGSRRFKSGGTDGPLNHESPKYMLNGSRGLRHLVTSISNRQTI